MTTTGRSSASRSSSVVVSFVALALSWLAARGGAPPPLFCYRSSQQRTASSSLPPNARRSHATSPHVHGMDETDPPPPGRWQEALRFIRATDRERRNGIILVGYWRCEGRSTSAPPLVAEGMEYIIEQTENGRSTAATIPDDDTSSDGVGTMKCGSRSDRKVFYFLLDGPYVWRSCCQDGQPTTALF